MPRLIDFAKIEATGNDFIFIDKHKNKIDRLSTQNIISMCDRHFGIGADGIVLSSENTDQQIKMEYFNADGSRGEMCGNALRGIVLFNYLLGKIKTNTWRQVEVDDGEHHVFMKSPGNIQVEIKVKDQLKSKDWDHLKLTSDLMPLGFINTGVPHLVLETKSELEQIDVIQLGREFRYNELFQPAGTNVNFLKIKGKNKLHIRTYERGVENETLSCGTGIIACAIAYWNSVDNDKSEISVNTSGGRLRVFYDNSRLFLKGAARVAFVGQYSYV